LTHNCQEEINVRPEMNKKANRLPINCHLKSNKCKLIINMLN
jgi:hypothetical protein